MGFSSSQCRLLSLTNRKHDISRELMVLSARKQAITREAKEASLEYNNSFNANIFKWSPNGGATYTDITYGALMTPTAGVSGSQKPILLTDTEGRVVVDTKYLQYAKMISPNGQPGGDWESNRLTILEEITGIDSSAILANDTTKAAADKASKATEEAYSQLKKQKTLEPVVYENMDGLIKKMPSNIQDAYKGSQKIHVSSKSEIESLINSISSSLKSFLSDEDFELWQEACQGRSDFYGGNISQEKYFNDSSANLVMTGKVNDADINVEELFKEIISNYKGDKKQAETGNNTPPRIGLRDRSEGSEWSVWKANYENSQAIYQAAVTAEGVAADAYNQAMDSTENRNKISFYDHLFTAIAEQGWIYDEQVADDSSYLNNMLQNNCYNLTLMTVNNDYEEGSTALSKMNKYDYTVGSAYYNDNLIKVNDPNVRYEALAVYENRKNEINEKESRIDLRMEKLQTELQAINSMIETDEKIRDKNSETYFAIFA